jgi:hypothetical protein
MASLESLPSDQRAVLELVLRRGRSYDEIAQLLSIDRAGVRERALAALDALGPEANVPPERRALITDYLLGQLPERVAQDTRERLGESAGERAWARVVASELAPLAGRPLPEIPVGPVSAERSAAAEPVETVRREPTPQPSPAPSAAATPRAAEPRPAGRGPGRARSSRRGGAILLGALAAIVIAAIVVVIVASGGSSKPKTTAHGSTTARTGTSTSASATPLAQINLVSPTTGSNTAGIALVIRQGTVTAIAIRAQHVPANTHNDAYAVWLSNAPSDSVRLGFVNPSVGSNGILQALGQLPSNAAHYKQVLVTLETTQNPRTPGTIVLEGALSGV